MKSPITGKEMSLRMNESKLTFRKEDFRYYHFGYYCDDSGECFTTTEIDELNLNQVYNKYRDKHNIPFPDEIIELRKKLGFSANKMSFILGLGPNGYKNYEKGEVPSLVIANLLSTILKNSSNLRDLVKNNPELKDVDREKILNSINRLITQEEENTALNSYLNQILGSSLPDIFSGYRKPNMEKLSEMVVFFTEKLSPTKTAMNKLLFYSDFLNFKKTGYSISGVRYFAHNYGPVPSRFNGIFDYLTIQNVIDLRFEEYPNGYCGERFETTELKTFNSDPFTDLEIETLNSVKERFTGLNATQIKDISHEENAWIDNEKKKNLIKYTYGFDLKNV